MIGKKLASSWNFLSACFAIGLMLLGQGIASAQVTLPTEVTGAVDVAGYVTALITALAAVVAVVVGGFFAFRVIKMALRWTGRAGG